MKALLEQRNALKAKKPTFTKHDAHKKARVGTGWRRPKGIQNKMRLGMKGYARARSTGFGSPLAVKGLSREGLTQHVVSSKEDFAKLDPKTDGVIIARTLGAKKKVALLAYATEKNFTLLNIDAKVYEANIKGKLDAKANRKKALLNKKAANKKAAEKAAAKDKKQEAKVDEKESTEDKKVQEKKEHDKVLTKKDGN